MNEEVPPIDLSKIHPAIEVYDAHMASLNAAFVRKLADPKDKGWVKEKLRHMVEIDQYTRGYWNDAALMQPYSNPEKKEFQRQIISRGVEIDRQNTADMKELLGVWGWFTVSLFGAEADRDAWLLVQHADHDHDFQEQVLDILEKLYPQGETSPANYAYLYDRISVAYVFNNCSPRNLQRYGTQMTRDEAGELKPFPVEDPTHLDERRLQMGLKPMAQYLKKFPTP